MNPFQCILFSDNYSIDEITLKKAILTFDSIRIIDANHHSCLVPDGSITDTFIYPDGRSMTIRLGEYGSVIKGKGAIDEFNNFLEKNKIALDKNILLLSDPNEALFKRGRILRLCYEYDKANTDFMNICIEGINQKIFDGNKIVNVDARSGIIEGLAIAPTGFKSPWSLLPPSTEEPFSKITDQDLSQSIKFLSYSRIVKLLTVIAISDEYNAIPVTDNPILNNLILFKFKWLSELEHGGIRSALNMRSSEKDFKYSVLSQAIIKDIIPDDQLKEISIRKLIAYKKASNEQLRKYRNKLLRIIDLIQLEPWDDKLKCEIENLINKEIIPDVDKYIDKKIELKDKLIGSYIKVAPDALLNTLKLAVPVEIAIRTFPQLFDVAYLFPNLTMPEIIFFSGLFGANIIKESIKTLVDNYIEKRKEHRCNSLSYLLKIKDSV